MNIVRVFFVLLSVVVVNGDKFIDKRPPKTTSSSESLKPWPRTRNGKFELVTPTVVDGITFSASPKDSYKTPPPWVSLKKDGRPKTIKPKIKGGDVKNDWPDYDTYFDVPVTKTHDLSKVIEGHEGERYFKEVKLVPEDKADKYLNPLIRCTPDRYFNRRGGKKNSDPFCTPTQNSHILLDQVHWVTWYTRYFDDDEKVRLHMAYVEDTGETIQKRDGKVGGAAEFFTSEWTPNDGFFPLEIEEDWLLGQYEQLAVLGIQPESVDESEFNLLNGTIVKIRKGPTVIRGDKQEKLTVKPLSDDGIIMALLSIPTVILFFGFCYMMFVYCTKEKRTFNTRELRQLSKQNRHHKYSRLPSHRSDLKRS